MKETVIEPGSLCRGYARQLLAARDLVLLLARRDLTLRYRQTAIGVLWAVAKPAVAVVVFSIVFGSIARLPSNGIAYPLIVLAAIAPWQVFANVFTECSTSVVNHAGLITKVRFPRLVLPLSCTFANVVDHLVTVAVVAAAMVCFGWRPGWTVLLLPLASLATLMTSFGAGVWIAALMVRYRDMRNITAFLLQAALLLSPVAFTAQIVDPDARALYALNPLVGPLETFRWALLGPGFAPTAEVLLVSSLTGALVLASGVLFFVRQEARFADVV